MASFDSNQELVDLKHMVMSFRVSELQMLLRTAQRNKSGRKHDLMTRALQLVKNGCNAKIQDRIKELYHMRFPRAKQMQHSSSVYDFDLDKKKKVSEIEHMSENQMPVHPKVKFKSLPFYDVMSDVVKPTSLISRAHRAYSKCEMTFILSEEQVETICKSSSKENMRKFNSQHQIQVQLRFSLLETTCEQKDLLPPNLSVKVNHHQANLPPFIPPSKAGVEPKRASRPIDITLLCRLSHVSYNQIEVTWSSEYGKNYAMCINVVQQQTSDMLMVQLRLRGIRNAGHSRTLIMEKLTRDPDSEIATTSLKVSLLCPLGKMRMNVPARPATCTHMQCFDAMLYLQMNERKPTWICPVCNKPADFSNLFIDGLFMDILAATDCEEIVFLEDGQWQPFQQSKESHSLCTPKKAIALDLSSSPSSSPKDKQKEPEVIDLTCDSSDEEPEVPTVNKRTEEREREREEIHSLSSTSPCRSEVSVPHAEDQRTPPKRSLQQEHAWPPQKAPQQHRSPGLPGFYGSAHSSPRPSSFGLHEAAGLDRSTQPPLSRTPNFTGSRDGTPSLHMGPVFNPGIPFPGNLDYNAPSPLDYSILLNQAFDPMRRMQADHSLRSSPFALGQPPPNTRLYPPSSHSSSEDIARSYLASYPPSHPYSPLTYLPSADSPLDIIPID